jgi:predicted small lipoprotein YifL
MTCWAHNLFIALVIALGTLGLLGACGQKGELFLPEPATETHMPPGDDIPRVPEPSNRPKTGTDQL